MHIKVFYLKRQVQFMVIYIKYWIQGSDSVGGQSVSFFSFFIIVEFLFFSAFITCRVFNLNFALEVFSLLSDACT